MAFGIVDTPQTELGDRTRLNPIAELDDFSTQQSIPSPTKEGNDLRDKIRGMRQSAIRTPKHRAPFADRRNGARPEFTPLLQSATRNHALRRSLSGGKENRQLQTPAALKADFREGSSPALPFNSSIMIEDHTGDTGDTGAHEPLPPHMSSSSALSTPMAIRPQNGNGPLEHNGPMATLREQEARLEHLDKENFNLKLKIHFLEEAMRRSGKDFNEAALRENTDLKIDKVTLQKELRQFRRQLLEAEKDRESLRRQLAELASTARSPSADVAHLQEAQRLRDQLSEKDSEIKRLQEQLDAAIAAQTDVRQLQDENEDLKAELRACENTIDEKDEQIETLKQHESRDDELSDKIDELNEALAEKDEQIRRFEQQTSNEQFLNDDIRDLKQTIVDLEANIEQLERGATDSKASAEIEKSLKAKIADLEIEVQEKDDDLKGYQDAIRTTAAETEQKLRSKDRQLEMKDDEIRELEDQMQRDGRDQSLELHHRKNEMETKDRELDDLRRKYQIAEDSAQHAEALREELDVIKSSLANEQKCRSRIVEERDLEIKSLGRKLEALQSEESVDAKLREQIEDLEYDVRQKQNALDEAQDQIDDMKNKLGSLENDADDELLEAQDRIQELESQQERNLKELQTLRLSGQESQDARQQALEALQQRVRQLQDELETDKAHALQLQQELSQSRSKVREFEALKADKEHLETQKRTMNTTQIESDAQITHLRKQIESLQKAQESVSSRETQLQSLLDEERKRHTAQQEALRQVVSTAGDSTLQHSQVVRNLQDELNRITTALTRANRDLAESKDKVRSLEDEIEVIDSAEDEVKRTLRAQLEDKAAEIASLSSKLASSQKSLEQAEQELRNAKQQIGTRPAHRSSATPSPQRDLRRQVRDLEVELLNLKDERQQMQSELQDTVAATTSKQADLQNSLNRAEADRDLAQAQFRELRNQLQDHQRDAERRSKAAAEDYEDRIRSLEQDLTDAQFAGSSLQRANQAAEQTAGKLKIKIANLEQDLSKLVKQPTKSSADERESLQGLLRDAELEVEDLQQQLSEREARAAAYDARETSLREQLRRVREDRATQSARADSLDADLGAALDQLELLSSEVETLRQQSRSVRFPKASVSSTSSGAPGKDGIERRHASEIRGMVRQIEYLAARCKREERFRSDLSFVKGYFTQLVAMHTRCTAVDLRLVKAMGIPSDAVLADEKRKERTSGPGRIALKKGRDGEVRSRPSLLVVAKTVQACVRMQSVARKWTAIRERHDGLVKKLGARRKDVGPELRKVSLKNGSGKVRA